MNKGVEKMKVIKILIAAILILGINTSLIAKSSASHTVTIRVLYANEFSVEMEPEATNNMHMAQYNDNKQPTYNLGWNTGKKDQKITVASKSSSLRLLAHDLTNDVISEMPLSNKAANLINGSSSRKGKVKVQYVDDALSDNCHNVVYTLTDS